MSAEPVERWCCRGAGTGSFLGPGWQDKASGSYFECRGAIKDSLYEDLLFIPLPYPMTLTQCIWKAEFQENGVSWG